MAARTVWALAVAAALTGTPVQSDETAPRRYGTRATTVSTYDGLAAALSAGGDAFVDIATNQTMTFSSPLRIDNESTVSIGSTSSAVLSGSQQSTLFQVFGRFALANVTIRDGAATNLSVQATDCGGAIYVATGGFLKLTSTTFVHNYATSGGAVYSHGDVTIFDSVFTRNTAGYQGGAVASLNGRLSIARSELSSNMAIAAGGAVYQANSYPVDSPSLTTLKITDSTFRYNSANFGGAQFSAGTWSTALVKTTIYEDNAADCGGALYTLFGKIIDLVQSTFMSNRATTGGAVFLYSNFAAQGNYTSSDNVFELNTADERGGALYVWMAVNVRVSGSYFALNHATDGGAVAVYEKSAVQLADSTFYSNSAVNGGALEASDRSVIAVTASGFYENLATSLASDDIFNDDSEVTCAATCPDTDEEGRCSSAECYACVCYSCDCDLHPSPAPSPAPSTGLPTRSDGGDGDGDDASKWPLILAVGIAAVLCAFGAIALLVARFRRRRARPEDGGQYQLLDESGARSELVEQHSSAQQEMPNLSVNFDFAVFSSPAIMVNDEKRISQWSIGMTHATRITAAEVSGTELAALPFASGRARDRIERLTTSIQSGAHVAAPVILHLKTQAGEAMIEMHASRAQLGCDNGVLFLGREMDPSLLSLLPSGSNSSSDLSESKSSSGKSEAKFDAATGDAIGTSSSSSSEHSEACDRPREHLVRANSGPSHHWDSDSSHTRRRDARRSFQDHGEMLSHSDAFRLRAASRRHMRRTARLEKSTHSVLTKLRAVGMFSRVARERAALRVLRVRRSAPPLLALPADTKRLIAEFACRRNA